MISIEDRVNYYYGNFSYDTNYPEIEKVPINHKAFRYSFGADLSKINQTYIPDIIRYAKIAKDKLFFFIGDTPYVDNFFPVLTKIRERDNPLSNGVISNLNTLVHWDPIKFVLQIDVSWFKKNNKIRWRGSDTGIHINDGRYNRLDFVKDYKNKYDIGFNKAVGCFHHKIDLSEYMKPSIGIRDLLTQKYHICIDGNDKASCLNWVLASNSVPIMPKPKFHSWLCEPWLEPNVHYVEINDDFSNLEEKINWCQENDEECYNIAVKGKEFIMQNFGNIHDQLAIEKTLIEKIEYHICNLG